MIYVLSFWSDVAFSIKQALRTFLLNAIQHPRNLVYNQLRKNPVPECIIE